ncbi:MAG: hypothetical protein K0S26_768 [Bacteroidota bacterium]|jgi:hypothetical protein|nr:hypothetical protein [Bacteroidota bacterium]
MRDFLLKKIKDKRDVLFFLCVIFNTGIVFSNKYFPTLDSGAHAYNSNILYHLLLDDSETYKAFYLINPELVPNYLAHLVMLIFNSFLQFNLAEKLMLSVYFISFPLLFKKLVSSFNANKTYLVFLIFPFTHFCVLYWGFYNFAFGILFFLLGIIYWVNHRTNFKLKQAILLFIIVAMCYFSHLVAFMALVMFCGIYECMDFCLRVKIDFYLVFKEKMILFLKGILVFAFPLILAFLYFEKRPSEGIETFLRNDQLNDMLLNGDIFRSYGDGEHISTKPLFYLILITFVYALISRIKDYYRKKPGFKLIHLSDAFFAFSVVFFYLFYTQPDSDGYAGYIVIRLALYAFLAMVIWICITGKQDRRFEFPVLGFVLIFHCILFQGKKEGISWVASNLRKFDGAMERLKDGDIVSPVYLADYMWLGRHLPNYIGADKEVVVLDNYEATSGYFPILWKDENMAHYVNGTPESTEHCVNYAERLISYPFGEINYVLVYGERKDDELCKRLIDEITKYYDLDYRDKDVFLYKRKSHYQNKEISFVHNEFFREHN